MVKMELNRSKTVNMVSKWSRRESNWSNGSVKIIVIFLSYISGIFSAPCQDGGIYAQLNQWAEGNFPCMHFCVWNHMLKLKKWTKTCKRKSMSLFVFPVAKVNCTVIKLCSEWHFHMGFTFLLAICIKAYMLQQILNMIWNNNQGFFLLFR